MAKESCLRSCFLGLPHRDDFSAGTMWGVMFAGNKRQRVYPRCASNSILTLCFNTLWADALNKREEEDLAYFAMMHSDIGPNPGWLDVLTKELEDSGADLLSVVVPIKDGRGLTSTALRDMKTGRMKRLSMTEIMDLPETFTADDIGYGDRVLLVNTGLWVCDFTKPWVEDMFFQQADTISRNAEGKYMPSCMPEDWMFSLDAHRKGLVVKATRKVKVLHKGQAVFSNDEAWGSWKVDREEGDLGIDDDCKDDKVLELAEVA